MKLRWITDKAQIKEFKKYLQAYDGEGKMDDGTLVNRLVVGDIYPLGIGFTVSTLLLKYKEWLVEKPTKNPNQKRKSRSWSEIEVHINTHWWSGRNWPLIRKKHSSLSGENDVNMSNALIMDTKDLLEQIEGLHIGQAWVLSYPKKPSLAFPKLWWTPSSKKTNFGQSRKGRKRKCPFWS